MRTFGENLRELRKSRGYSQEKYCNKILIHLYFTSYKYPV